MQLAQIGILLCISVWLSACDGGVGSSNPQDIGVHIQTDNGWVMVGGYDYEGMMLGQYMGVSNLTPDQLPVAKKESRVYINKVPVDPSQIYLVANVDTKTWKGKVPDVPMRVRELGEGVYETNLSGLEPGIYNIYFKRGYSGRGHFIRLE
jgi:hypothetical protein